MDKTNNNILFLVYLAGLSVLGFLATDMYLPAFGIMQNDLKTSEGNISATLSIFLGGYAIAQLLWGPISDKLGKKKVLLIGLSMFAISSVVIYLVKSINVFLILRMFQAVGVCSAAVSWQALVVDNYPKQQTKRIFATIMPLVGLSPALAPLVGSFLLEHFGWRSIFIVLCIIASVLIIATFFIKERKSQLKSKNKQEGENFSQLLKSPVFTGNVIIYAACSAAFFSWLTGSPFILKNLGYTPGEIGLSYIPQTIAFLVGGYGYRFMAERISNKFLLPRILVLFSICMVSMFILTVSVNPDLFMLLIPFCVMALLNGACYPIVVAEALTPFPKSSGKASALQNTIQLGACFIASSVVSAFSDNPLLTTASVMLSTVMFVIAGYFISLRKY